MKKYLVFFFQVFFLSHLPSSLVRSEYNGLPQHNIAAVNKISYYFFYKKKKPSRFVLASVSVAFEKGNKKCCDKKKKHPHTHDANAHRDPPLS